MNTDLDRLVDAARAAFAAAMQPAALENEKARYLGKNGAITERLKALAKLAPEEKRTAGASINAAKEAIEALLAERRQALAELRLDEQLAAESIDVSLPGRSRSVGVIHPIARTWMRVEEIFRSIGFDFAEGPEIETDWYNFTALNSPENHPARSMQDTFYVDAHDKDGRPMVLRTHTSPMQVRYARMHQPPIKVIAIGRCYRVDNDATHSPMFHQVEGLWPDEDISFADLKAVYTNFLRCFFETDELRGALQAFVLSIHRALSRDRHDVHQRFAQGPLARNLGCGASASRCRAQFRFRSRKRRSALPSARVSSGWQCCAMASMTCACSSTAICASFINSPSRCSCLNSGYVATPIRRIPATSWPSG